MPCPRDIPLDNASAPRSAQTFSGCIQRSRWLFVVGLFLAVGIVTVLAAQRIDHLLKRRILAVAMRCLRHQSRFFREILHALLEVRDTGCGIAPEDLNRVFEPFFTTRASIGTGIGLWVARQFMEGHGGAIEAVSSTDSANHGTTMSVYLPMQPDEANSATSPA